MRYINLRLTYLLTWGDKGSIRHPTTSVAAKLQSAPGAAITTLRHWNLHAWRQSIDLDF